MGKFDLKDILNERSKVNDMQSTDEIKIDGEVELIDIYKMIPSKDNHYSVKEIDDLVATIPMAGILQPLLLNESDEEEDMYEIVAGHRRRTACIYLVEQKGMKQYRYVPAIIKPKKSQTLQKLALIVANRFRDKSDWERMMEVVELKSIFNEILENRKLDKQTQKMLKELLEIQTDEDMKLRDFMAKSLNISATQVARYEKIHNSLSEVFMTAFQAKNISISIAYELATLSPEWQEKAEGIYNDLGYMNLQSVEMLKMQEKASKPIPGQMTIEEQEEKETEEQKEPEQDIKHFVDGVLNSDNGYGWYRHKIVHEFLATRYEDSKIRQAVSINVHGSWMMVERKENVTVFCGADGKPTFDVENSRLEKEYQEMLDAEKNQTLEEPRPVYKDVPCYSCLHYADCDKKSAAVSECDQYKNKAEAEKTEEQRYSEEQDKIDRETRKKMHELAEKKFEKLPPVEQERSNEPKVITLSIRQFAELEYKERNFLLVMQQDYRKDDKLILKELVRGQESGKALTATVGYVMQEHTGIEDKYCILGLKNIYGGINDRAGIRED
ncbi:MAG: DUF3850 domain-containing protein [Lachnospiraceae bacterium]|nr:DUF3850 domain-containing protein [Lachnospiraceae bacterium]